MTAKEVYEEVEYLERVSNDGPVNYKEIAILAMERYTNRQSKELEAKIIAWYAQTKDENYQEFMNIQIYTHGNIK